MSETTQDSADRRRPGRGWGVVAAVLVVAVPILIGLLVLSGDGDDGTQPPTTSGDLATGGGVRPFSEIQAGDIVIEPDPSGAGAVLRVSTSIDVVCAVAYGPTAELGSIATDTDMAGGAHSDHHPLMSGLEPGTTYFYRLAGTAPDGSLFQSDLRQFTHRRAEGAAAVQPPAPNVAGMATVGSVSSEFSSAFAAENAIDGDLATEWSSAGDGDDAYVTLEFDDEVDIAGAGFRTRVMSDGSATTTSFTVTVDGRRFGPFEAAPGLSVATFHAVGSVVRFDVEASTGGNTGAIEVEVYGAVDGE